MFAKPTYEELEQRIRELEKVDSEYKQKVDLCESKEKFKALFENSPIGIAYHRMIYNERGKPINFYYLDANSNFQQFTGSDPTGKLVTEVFPGIDKDPNFDWIATCAKAARDGETVRFQQYLQPVDRWYDIVAFQNKPDHFVVSFLEITELKRAEEERKKLQDQLAQAQKMEAIGTLAGGIAHDFNNILSGVFGFSYLAKKHINNTEKAGNYIDQLTKGAQKATELVQQILTFSRKSKPEKYPLKISLIVKEALKLLRSSIPTTIAIKDNIISQATVLADPTQVHQIIMNLCTNAYHAMSETGGILAVSLKEIEISDKDTIPGLSISPGDYLKLEVSDDGHGMDSKILDKIFDPYFTTKEIGQGTGLGLSVVIGIIKEHNGFIRVYSEVEKGTTFHIFLPTIDKEAVSYTLQEKEDIIVRGTEKIMIVDDDEVILTVTHQ